MTERGVFALDRGWFDHPVFAPEPFTEREAWAWLISSAAWKPRAVRVGSKVVELKRGQAAFSVRFLAEKWQWSKSRVDRFLGRLENQDMVGTESGTGVTVVTICNYDKYQKVSLPDRDSSGTQTGTAAGQQRDKEEDKEDKEESSEPKKALRLRAHPLPANFALTEADRQVARSEGWTEAKIDSELQRFKDHAAANGRKQVDWRAAWRNWVRSPFQNAPRAGPTNGHGAAGPRPGSREDRQERLANVLQAIDPRTRPHANDGRSGESPATPIAGLLPLRGGH